MKRITNTTDEPVDVTLVSEDYEQKALTLKPFEVRKINSGVIAPGTVNVEDIEDR